MTKPKIRARDAKIGIDIIADELQAAAILEGRTLSRNQAQNQAKNQMGDLPISAMEIKEALAREARASGLFIPIAEQLDSETRENVSQTLQPAVNAAAPIVQDIRRQAAPFAAQAQQAGTDFVNPIRQTMLDEMNPREQALRAVAGSQ